jgi:hypothetical protein
MVLRRLAPVHALNLHCCRHTYALLALEASRSIRFVAEQLVHANPELTLRQYAHALPLESGDLNFADFETKKSGSKRLDPAPTLESDEQESPKYLNSMARREGLEPPTLRFEA